MSLWNDDNIEQLKTLWKEGHSASQIAEMLGEGFTKNAVIGKIHRLKFNNQGNRAPRPRAAAKPRPASTGVSRARRNVAKTNARAMDRIFASRLHHDPIPEIPFLLPDTTSYGHSMALMSLDGSKCKWPVGDPLKSDFRFCGAHAEGVYCTHHHAIAYKPASASRSTMADERRYA